MPVISARMLEQASELSKRFFYVPVDNGCNYGYSYDSGTNHCYYSGWLFWGRWVLLAVILAVIFLIFLGGSCVNARRRRSAGKQPMYGTAWMAPPTYDESQAQTGRDNYQMNNNQQQPAYAPPAYPPAADGQGAYAPPASPPPVKGKN